VGGAWARLGVGLDFSTSFASVPGLNSGQSRGIPATIHAGKGQVKNPTRPKLPMWLNSLEFLHDIGGIEDAVGVTVELIGGCLAASQEFGNDVHQPLVDQLLEDVGGA